MSLKSSNCISCHLCLLGFVEFGWKHRLWHQQQNIEAIFFSLISLFYVLTLHRDVVMIICISLFALSIVFPCHPQRDLSESWHTSWETLHYRIGKFKPKWEFQNCLKLLQIVQKICHILDPSFKNVWLYIDNFKFKEYGKELEH